MRTPAVATGTLRGGLKGPSRRSTGLLSALTSTISPAPQPGQDALQHDVCGMACGVRGISATAELEAEPCRPGRGQQSDQRAKVGAEVGQAQRLG